MKLLTVVVPCYNSQAYLAKCLDGLVPFAEELDIIVVNDGSTDNTLDIAIDYAERYPRGFRVVDKENGGHGSGINMGLDNARAPYFKVLDSDDRFDTAALRQVLTYLSVLQKQNVPCDLLVTNYVYEYHGADGEVSLSPIRFDNVFRESVTLTWNDMGSLRLDQLLQMHTAIYRTQLLRDIGLKLPEKTFYEDNLYMYEPLPAVKDIHYLNTDLYYYYIGRPDQTVNLDVSIKNIDMTLTITRTMIGRFKLYELNIPRKLRRYMIRHLRRMVAMCYMAGGIASTAATKKKLRDMRNHLKRHDKRCYRRVMWHPMIMGQRLLACFGKGTNRKLYTWIGKKYRFN